MGLSHHSNCFPALHIQYAGANQPGVHSGIKPAVMNHVVHVRVGVVVHPAHAQTSESSISLPRLGLRSGKGFCREHVQILPARLAAHFLDPLT